MFSASVEGTWAWTQKCNEAQEQMLQSSILSPGFIPVEASAITEGSCRKPPIVSLFTAEQPTTSLQGWLRATKAELMPVSCWVWVLMPAASHMPAPSLSSSRRHKWSFGDSYLL